MPARAGADVNDSSPTIRLGQVHDIGNVRACSRLPRAQALVKLMPQSQDRPGSRASSAIAFLEPAPDPGGSHGVTGGRAMSA